MNPFVYSIGRASIYIETVLYIVYLLISEIRKDSKVKSTRDVAPDRIRHEMTNYIAHAT